MPVEYGPTRAGTSIGWTNIVTFTGEHADAAREMPTERLHAALRELGIDAPGSPGTTGAAARVLAAAAMIGAGERVLFDQFNVLPPESPSTQELITRAHATHNAVAGWESLNDLTEAVIYRLVHLTGGMKHVDDVGDFSEVARFLFRAASRTVTAAARLVSAIIAFESGSDSVAPLLRDTDRVLAEVQPLVEYLADEFEMAQQDLP